KEEVYFAKITEFKLLIIRGRIQDDPHLLSAGRFDDIIYEIDLVLHKYDILLAEIRQHFIDIIFGKFPVCSSIQKNAVLSALIHLNDRMSRWSRNFPYIMRMNIFLPAKIHQHLSVFSDHSGMVDFQSCPCKGNRLIQPFTAAENLSLRCI